MDGKTPSITWQVSIVKTMLVLVVVVVDVKLKKKGQMMHRLACAIVAYLLNFAPHVDSSQSIVDLDF